MPDPSWWKDRWQEDKSTTNWEHARAKESNPQEVLAGIKKGFQPPDAPRAQLLNQDGQQGRSVALPIAVGDANTNPWQTILNADGDDRRSRTVTIHCIQEQLAFAGGLREVEGRIKWGTAGVQATALFDFIHGTSFSVAASFVRIEARRNDPTDLTAAAGQVGAFIGYDSLGVGRSLQPQLTVKIDALAPAALSAAVLIPSFATGLWVHRSSGAGGVPAIAFNARLFDQGAVDIYREQYALGEKMQRPINLSNDMRFVIITNRDPAINANFRLVWELSL